MRPGGETRKRVSQRTARAMMATGRAIVSGPTGFRESEEERECDARRAWSSFAQQLPYSFPGTREGTPGTHVPQAFRVGSGSLPTVSRGVWGERASVPPGKGRPANGACFAEVISLEGG